MKEDRIKLVVGCLGNVGTAIKYIFKASGIDFRNGFYTLYHTDGFETTQKELVDIRDCLYGLVEKNARPIIMHICLPFSENYFSIVDDYINLFSPMLVLNHTSCPVGTTRKLFELTETPIVHCPINGRHPNMVDDIRKYKMFVGALDEETGQRACEYIEWHGLDTYLCSSPEITELSKLASTELIRVNIEFYQRTKKRIKDLGLNWAEFIAFMQELMDKGNVYKRVYQRAGKIDTPFSKKHCIMSNKELFDKEVK